MKAAGRVRAAAHTRHLNWLDVVLSTGQPDLPRTMALAWPVQLKPPGTLHVPGTAPYYN
mgnify:CR=1 FL=1